MINLKMQTKPKCMTLKTQIFTHLQHPYVQP